MLGPTISLTSILLLMVTTILCYFVMQRLSKEKNSLLNKKPLLIYTNTFVLLLINIFILLMAGTFIRSFLVTISFLGGFQLIKEPKNQPYMKYIYVFCITFFAFYGGMYPEFLYYDYVAEKKEREWEQARENIIENLEPDVEKLFSEKKYEEALKLIATYEDSINLIKDENYRWVYSSKKGDYFSEIENKIEAELERIEAEKIEKIKQKSFDKYLKKGYLYAGDTKESRGKITDKNLTPLTGMVFHLHDNGNLSELIEYRKGVKIDDNVKTYYENGSKKYFKSKNNETYYYDNGKKKSSKNLNTRELKKYYPNGKLKLKGQYDKYDGHTGTWVEYYDNGKVKLKYNHDKYDWLTFFHENGNRAEERQTGWGEIYLSLGEKQINGTYRKTTQRVTVTQDRICFDENDNKCDCSADYDDRDHAFNRPLNYSQSFGCSKNMKSIDSDMIPDNSFRNSIFYMFRSEYYHPDHYGKY